MQHKASPLGPGPVLWVLQDNGEKEDEGPDKQNMQVNLVPENLQGNAKCCVLSSTRQVQIPNTSFLPAAFLLWKNQMCVLCWISASLIGFPMGPKL